jgi:type II secretory pathway component PulM
VTAPSLHMLSPALAGAWDRASRRERALIALAAAVVAFAVLWLSLWQPMNADIARLERDLPRTQAVLAAARAQSDDLVALQRSSARAKTGDPRAAVERVLAERGLRAAAGTLDLQDGRVRLGFPTVRFDALVGLLDTLAKAEGLRAVDATLTARVEAGTVRADVTLAR